MGKEYHMKINSVFGWDNEDELINAVRTVLRPTTISVKKIIPDSNQHNNGVFEGFFNFTPITPEGRLILCGIECGIGMVIDRIQSPEKIADEIKEMLLCTLMVPENKLETMV